MQGCMESYALNSPQPNNTPRPQPPTTPVQAQVKVHRRVGGAFETLRLSLSSLNGGFLKPKMLREFPDPAA